MMGETFSERITSDLTVGYKVKRVLYSGRTKYQTVKIIETDSLGASLILDGKTQSAQVDEHVYHESLVYPPMLFHPKPRNVFIGGGGEGATLRRVLNNSDVDRVVMIDLDREVVDICREYLPGHSQGAFDDPRCELLYCDARDYLMNSEESFDVMVMDLVDPLENGTAYSLYTRDFYQLARSRLKPGGILVTQAGPTGLLNYRECFTPIVVTLSQVFTEVLPYTVNVPSFMSLWGFVVAFTEPGMGFLSPEDVNRLISIRFDSAPKFYDGITHEHMFALPSYLRTGIAEEQRVISDIDPVFMI